MKHFNKFTLLLLAFLFPLIAVAHDFEVNGIYYNLEDNKAVVTWRGSQYFKGNKTTYSGAVTIPATVTYKGTKYSVTSIGMDAFAECRGLTSVSIPNSVISIGGGAFSQCSGLTSISIPNSVTSIGGGAFAGCTGLTHFEIPNSVTSLGSNVFDGCIHLSDISIPNSVTDMWKDTFKGTPYFENQPDGVLYAGLCAYGYKGNTPEEAKIVLKEGTKSIAGEAFRSCSWLTEMVIPNSVVRIGALAFRSCDNLKNVVLSNSIDTIDSYAFEGCTALTSIVIPNSVVYIGREAFRGCGITSVNIPSSVVDMGLSPFLGCKALKELTYNVKKCSVEIGYFPNLMSVSIGEGVEELPSRFIARSKKITSITVPSTVKKINDGAFSCCTELKTIICLATTPPAESENKSFFSSGGFFSDEIFASATLQVPSGSVEAYKASKVWGKFARIVEIRK